MLVGGRTGVRNDTGNEQEEMETIEYSFKSLNMVYCDNER